MTTALTVSDAIAIASAWMKRSELPFSSAFIGGSVATADVSSPYDPLSDIDCYLVVDGYPPEGKIGKIVVDGVLLDVSWIPWKHLEDCESDAVLASLLHFGRVVVDDGRLSGLKQSIDTTFTSTEKIRKRLENMRAKIRSGLAANTTQLSHPEQVMNWLFPATLATHIPLVAACAPLTVRKRFLAARAVMEPDRYEELLALYGFDAVTQHQAEEWLSATSQLFDATVEIARESNRFWATDIQAASRHIAIDASRALVDSGNHREAMYWIIATSSRCLTVRDDTNADAQAYLADFNSMLEELDLQSRLERSERSEAILDWITLESRH